MRRLFLASLLLVTLSLLLAGSLVIPPKAARAQSAKVSPWLFDGYNDLLAVPEPSGLCYYPKHDTLFIVNDGGELCPPMLFEINYACEVLGQLELGNDLEGVCYCPLDGLLYVVDELDELIYVVDPEALTRVGQFQLSRQFAAEELLTAGGNGIEGIEFIADDAAPGGGYFLLLNQDDPHCLLRLDYAQLELGGDEPLEAIAWWPVAEINLGELHYDSAAGELWVVHSWMNVMEIYDVATMELKRWEVVPGSAQEAVAIDGQGRLWVGYDSGGIARYLLPATEKQPEDEESELPAEPASPAEKAGTV